MCGTIARWWLSICVSAAALVATAAGQPAERLLARAVDVFADGRFAEAASMFDRVADASPEYAPHLWQRGIALYYAGRFADCRRQFESHRAVNPDDVENAAWHFLCVAQLEGAARARAALLPVGRDPRLPMREVYELFRGAAQTADVIAAAGKDTSGRFYANLYVGLHAEALGESARSLQHLKESASPRYAGVGGYMHMVAAVHVRARSGAQVVTQ